METPYRVIVVVDRDYGQRLLALPPDVPVWIVDTPNNVPAIKQRWVESPEGNHLTGVASFKTSADRTPEQMFLEDFDTVDLHHGAHSADPPYTVLEVIGVSATAAIKAELAKYGFQDYEVTEAGFIARRSLASARQANDC